MSLETIQPTGAGGAGAETVEMQCTNGGRQFVLRFVSLTTTAALMEAVPELGAPSPLVSLWFPLTRRDVDPDRIVKWDDARALEDRASTHDFARAMMT